MRVSSIANRKLLCRAHFQHRHEPEEIKCHEGSCEALFYHKLGTRHAVICEMYSTGTEQQRLCKEERDGDSAVGTRAGLLLAIGGVIFVLILSP